MKSIIGMMILVMVFFTGCSSSDEYNELQTKIVKLEENIEEMNKINEELSNKVEGLKEENLQLSNSYQDFATNQRLSIVTVSDDTVKYIFEMDNENRQTVNIIGSNVDSIVENYESITIGNKTNMSDEVIVEVIGSVYDFQLISLEWNEATEKLEEKEIKEKISEVRDQRVLINTILPCGIPIEKVKWKDDKDKEHELLLAFDGYGFNGTILWSE